MSRSLRLVATALAVALILEPVVWATKAFAVTITISQSYGTTTGVTTFNETANTQNSTFSIQGPQPTLQLTNAGWVEPSPGCINTANAIQAGTVPGTVTCTNPNPPSSCVTVPGGATACNSSLPSSPITGIPNDCLSVSVSTNPANQDTCSQYQQNPSCTQQGGSTCVYTDSSGNCQSYSLTYNCGSTQQVQTGTAAGTVTCPGTVDCSNGSCLNLTTQTNNSFGKAAAFLQAAQNLQSDGSCASNGNCTVFSGTAGKCKDYYLFGVKVKDCCAQSVPTPPLGQYIDMVVHLNALDNSLMAINKANGQFGAWATVHNAIAGTGTQVWSSISKTAQGAWNQVTQPLSQSIDNLLGTSASSPSTVATAASPGLEAEGEQFLMRQTNSFISSAFSPQLAGDFFQPVAGSTTGALQLAPGLETASVWFGYAMAAYTVYQVAVILINLAFKCTSDQFSYLEHKKMDVCHVIGVYCAHYVCLLPNPFGGCAGGYCGEYDESGCCFDSPLSRILQEQIRPQLGISWGTPASPNCSGLTVQQLGNVDWSKVNLSEWTAILMQTGNYPTQSSINMATTTSASGPSTDVSTGSSTSTNALQRAQNKIWGGKTTSIRQSINQGMWK